MPYPTLADVNATTDLSNLLIYVNDITSGWAAPTILFSFFVIVLLGGAFAQIRFKGGLRIDYAFAVAAFTTFGLAVLMSIKTGLLNPLYLLFTLALSIAGAVWLYFSQDS